MSNEVELISFCKDYGKFSACKNINFYAEKIPSLEFSDPMEQEKLLF